MRYEYKLITIENGEDMQYFVSFVDGSNKPIITEVSYEVFMILKKCKNSEEAYIKRRNRHHAYYSFDEMRNSEQDDCIDDSFIKEYLCVNLL